MKMWPDGRLNDTYNTTKAIPKQLLDYAQINVRQQKKQQVGFKYRNKDCAVGMSAICLIEKFLCGIFIIIEFNQSV